MTYNLILVSWQGPVGLEETFAQSEQLPKENGSLLLFSNLVKLSEPTEVNSINFYEYLMID